VWKPVVFSSIKTALLCAALALSPRASLAQGSAGGSIGNDDKQLSGSREAKPARPEESHRPAAHRKEAGGGRGNFDGRWSFVTTGCPGAGTIGAVIRSGRFTTAISHGTVSPDGAFHAVGGGGGVSFTAGGHMGASGGSGTFRRSDGCSGSWSAQRL
jgi:hypothetical protein